MGFVVRFNVVECLFTLPFPYKFLFSFEICDKKGLKYKGKVMSVLDATKKCSFKLFLKDTGCWGFKCSNRLGLEKIQDIYY